MTLTVCIAVAVLIGTVAGLAVVWLFNGHSYRRGVLAGQRQSELAHGWHPALFGEVNPGYPATDRHRSADDKLVTRQPSESPDRPVFHRP